MKKIPTRKILAWETYNHPGMIIEGEEMAWHIGAEDDGFPVLFHYRLVFL